MKTSYILSISIVLLIVSFSCNNKSQFELNNEKVRTIIASLSDSVNAVKYFPDKDVRNYLHKEFDQFYKDRGFSLAWLDFDQPLGTSEELLEAIDHADLEGLEPQNYNLTKIEKLLHSIYQVESKKEKRKHRRARKSLNKNIREEARNQDTLRLKKIVQLDFLMTSSYLTYASHLLSGKINPYESESWFTKPRKMNLSSHLENAIKNKNIRKSLEDLLPKHPQYGLLKNELIKLYHVQQADSLPKVSLSKKLRPNQSNPSVILIKRKLALVGDFSGKDSSNVLDENLVNSIERFQERHGLSPSGIVDQATINFLNWPIKAQIQQIKVNMERMRWLPDQFGQRYILVNIPEFKMRLYEDGKKKMEMKVIVGTNYNPTPVFSDTMEYIVFNPTWTVPKKIAIKEFLPKIKENPDFLSENNYLLYDSWKKDAEPMDCSSIDWEAVDSTNFNLRIVEGPGERNSLGQVKFIFPNSLDVYLHDTPGDHLFTAKNRTFSHGCVRLEKPFELAAYLLKDKKWNLDTINYHIKTNKEPETVLLPEKIPVHIVYWTAWVDDHHILNFARDIYKHDKEQGRAIKKKEALM